MPPWVGHFRFSTRSPMFRFSEGGGFNLGNLPSKVMVEAKLLIKAVHEGQTRRWACILVCDDGGRPSSRKSEDMSLTSGQLISLRQKILCTRLLIPIQYSSIIPSSGFQAFYADLGPVRRQGTLH